MADQPAVPAPAPAPAPAVPAAPEKLVFERRTPGVPTSFIAPNAGNYSEGAPPKPAAPAAQPEPAKPAEAKPPEPPKPAEPQTRISQAIASLARKERQIVTQQQLAKQQLAQREAALKETENRLSQQQAELQRQLDELKTMRGDPLKWLQYGGHSYDALAQQMLADGRVPPETLVQQTRAQMEERISKERKELEARLDEEKKAREQLAAEAKQRREEEEQATVQRFRQEVLDFGRSNASRFPLTATLGEFDKGPLLIEQHYQQTLQADVEVAKREGRQPIGKLLSSEEAYGLIEQHYRGLYDQAQKVMNPPPAGAVPAPAPTPAPEPNTQGERPTITNNLASNLTPAPDPASLTEEERLKRAYAAWDAAQAGAPRR
jgi:hypothetical protein